jgi:hypothetical protein
MLCECNIISTSHGLVTWRLHETWKAITTEIILQDGYG